MNDCSINNLFLSAVPMNSSETWEELDLTPPKLINFDLRDRETSMSASLDANLQELVVLSTLVRTWIALQHFFLKNKNITHPHPYRRYRANILER